MKDIVPYLIWIAIFVAGIASSAAKAKKKRAEAARKAAQTAQKALNQTGQRHVKGGGPAQRERQGQAMMAQSPRQADAKGYGKGSVPKQPEQVLGNSTARKQPEPTSFDFHSLEESYVPHGSIETTARRTNISNVDATWGNASSRTGGQNGSQNNDTLLEAATTPSEEGNKTSLAEILGDEFDLRRAVIEAEILTPKYGQKY